MTTETEHGLCGQPYGVAAHAGGVGEEEEGAGHEGGVEDVHTRTAIDLLGEDDGEGYGEGEHPQRAAHGDNHRDEQTCHEVALLNLFLLPLGYDELNAEAHGVGDDNLGERHSQTIEEHGQGAGVDATANGVPVADVVHAEEQGGQQGDDDERHDALRVDGIMDAGAAARGGVRHEEERFHTLEYGMESVELAILLERGADFVEEFLYHDG